MKLYKILATYKYFSIAYGSNSIHLVKFDFKISSENQISSVVTHWNWKWIWALNWIVLKLWTCFNTIPQKGVYEYTYMVHWYECQHLEHPNTENLHFDLKVIVSFHCPNTYKLSRIRNLFVFQNISVPVFV